MSRCSHELLGRTSWYAKAGRSGPGQSELSLQTGDFGAFSHQVCTLFKGPLSELSLQRGDSGAFSHQSESFLVQRSLVWTWPPEGRLRCFQPPSLLFAKRLLRRKKVWLLKLWRNLERNPTTHKTSALHCCAKSSGLDGRLSRFSH